MINMRDRWHHCWKWEHQKWHTHPELVYSEAVTCLDQLSSSILCCGWTDFERAVSECTEVKISHYKWLNWMLILQAEQSSSALHYKCIHYQWTSLHLSILFQDITKLCSTVLKIWRILSLKMQSSHNHSYLDLCS